MTSAQTTIEDRFFKNPKGVQHVGKDLSASAAPSFVAVSNSPSYPIYQYSDSVPIPTKDNVMWGLPALYKEKGSRRRMWKIYFDSKTGEVITSFGLEDGKIQEDRIKIEPKANRTMYQQAWQETRRRYNLKFRNECYRPEGQSKPEFTKPMTAYKWEPNKTRLNFKAVGFNAVQPKFDGFRCMVTLSDDGKLEYVARSGRILPHFNKQFDAELSLFFDYLPFNVRIDGEMYLPGIKFQELSSILRNENTEHKNLKDVMYVIFDFDTHDLWPYDRRWYTLENAIKKFHEDGYTNTRFMICPTYKVQSEAEILQAHEIFTKKWKMEGTIIRKMLGDSKDEKILAQTIYKSGSRSHNILKYKDVMDEEATVVGIEDASGKESGKALLKVRFTDGVEFVIRFGSYIERETWFQNPKLVLGKQITIIYKERTKDGKPREPEGKAFRDADE